MASPQELMRLAIDAARRGVAKGQSPFGCAISVNGQILSAAHNVVLLTTDSTAHAEITALREACREAKAVHLTGAIVATTCEPCPMCMAAWHWARVDTVYYGATIADASAGGFNELHLPASEVLRIGKSDVKLIPGILADECRALFAEWASSPNARAY